MTVEKVKVLSLKGNLAVVIHKTENPTEKLAILCPGYLDSKDYKHLVALAEVLNKEDYTVVRFDPTGTWESEGNISDYNITQYLEDIKNVLEYMLSQGNYKNILLGGHSLGGQLSILYAARDSRISIVLGIMPSSRPISGEVREGWKKMGIKVSQRNLPNNENEKIKFPVPFSYVLDRDKYNAIEDIKKIKSPIILIAGELDDIIKPNEVEKLFNNANEPKKFINIPNIGHDYRYNSDEIALVNEKILEQLNLV